ncbi:RNHCP domain-containing protein [Streptomyces bohaiensis]|uniref:RNHCP domain-containing protein n=1 Tax=Streptomyces bohaiensis TaxID=1431344 RepID=UPI001ADD789F
MRPSTASDRPGRARGRPHRTGASAIDRRAAQNQGFTCENCARPVTPLRNGSYRNHCPHCLWSKHVDEHPGDRASECRGLMRPERVDQPRGKGLAVVHRCTSCGFTRPNRIADDYGQGDSIDAVSALMARQTRHLR